MDTFKLGDLVVLKTDPEQRVRIIVTIGQRGEGTLYEVAMGDVTSWHFAFEFIRVNE